MYLNELRLFVGVCLKLKRECDEICEVSMVVFSNFQFYFLGRVFSDLEFDVYGFRFVLVYFLLVVFRVFMYLKSYYVEKVGGLFSEILRSRGSYSG